MGCELRRQLREPGAFCVASMANCLGGAGTTGGLFFVYQALLRFWCLRLSPAWAQATEAVCRCCCCCCTGPRSPSSFDGSLAGWGLSVRSGVWRGAQLAARRCRSFVRSLPSTAAIELLVRLQEEAVVLMRGRGGGVWWAASVVVLRTDVVVIAGREAVVVFTRPTRHKLHRTTGGLWCVRYVPPAFGAGALS